MTSSACRRLIKIVRLISGQCSGHEGQRQHTVSRTTSVYIHFRVLYNDQQVTNITNFTRIPTSSRDILPINILVRYHTCSLFDINRKILTKVEIIGSKKLRFLFGLIVTRVLSDPKGISQSVIRDIVWGRQLKREKSRLGFIILTMLQSATLSSLPPPPLSFCSTFAPSRQVPKIIQIPPSSPIIPLFPAPRPADARIIAAKPCHKAVSHHKGLFNPAGMWKEKENRNQNTLYTSTPFSSFRSFVSPFHFLPIPPSVPSIFIFLSDISPFLPPPLRPSADSACYGVTLMDSEKSSREREREILDLLARF